MMKIILRPLLKNNVMIFEHELESCMTDPDEWPKNRSYKMFKEWFEIRVSDTVLDFGSDPIIVEEY